MLGHCQSQIKQSKALSMTNEMRVRKELCDFYDKQRDKQTREFARILKRREQEFEQDRQRQETLLREDMMRKMRDRPDQSLMSFEVHEKEEELRQELEEMREQLVQLKEWKRAKLAEEEEHAKRAAAW